MEVEDLVENKLKELKIPYKRNIKFLWNNDILEIDFLCPNILIEVKTSFDENNKEHTNQINRFDEIVPKNFKIIIFTLNGINKQLTSFNRIIPVFNNLHFLSNLKINYDIYFCHHHTILEFLMKEKINNKKKYYTNKRNFEIAQILINNQCQSIDWIDTNFSFNHNPIIYFNNTKSSYYNYKKINVKNIKDAYYHLFYFFHQFYQHGQISYFSKPRNHNPNYTYLCCGQILWHKIKCKKCKKKIDLKLLSTINI